VGIFWLGPIDGDTPSIVTAQATEGTEPHESVPVLDHTEHRITGKPFLHRKMGKPIGIPLCV